MLVVVLLCAAGVAGGYGVGRAVDAARDLLAGPASLPADKVAVPEPLDVGGPATTCRAQDVELRLSPSATVVTAGSPVAFMVSVRNVGRVPCLFDGADASRAVTISDEAGKEKVWSSAECHDGSRMLLLGPDGVDVGEVHWKSVQGCGKKAPVVDAGTYRATASLGDVPGATSEPVTFTVAEKAKPRPDPTETDDADNGSDKAPGEATDKASDKASDKPSEKAGDEAADKAGDETADDTDDGAATD